MHGAEGGGSGCFQEHFCSDKDGAFLDTVSTCGVISLPILCFMLWSSPGVCRLDDLQMKLCCAYDNQKTQSGVKPVL